MGARKVDRCSECGAVLEARPVRCPLCGTETIAPEVAERDRDQYQSNLRQLREELQRLREDDAEAV